MAYNLVTKHRYKLMDVASCLQKAIRRGDTKLAGYMAIEMFQSGFAAYCWKRLLTISAEDVADIVTQEVKALYDSWLILTDNGQKMKSRIFISKAVIVLCAARKCRDADHLTNYVYDREMVDAKALEALLDEAQKNPEQIPLPDYTFDCHTSTGKAKGKTKDDFFREEQAALYPKQPGLFDDLIDQPKTKPTSGIPD